MISEAIVDAGHFIGRFLEADPYRKRSLGLFKAFEAREIKRLFMTDYVVLEVINFMVRKGSQELAEDTIRFIFEADNIRLTWMEPSSKPRLMQIFKKFPGLS